MVFFAGNSEEYCELFQPTCKEDEVVLITKATYGRMLLGKCVKRDYGYVGCGTDVLSHLDYECSGRRTCSLRIPTENMDGATPCPLELKTYLDASYRCVKGTMVCLRILFARTIIYMLQKL